MTLPKICRPICLSCVVLLVSLSPVFTALPGTWFGQNQVFMFSEKIQGFKSTCICYQVEPGSSHEHMKFQLTPNGVKYDLCLKGYYLANITSRYMSVCKPCPEETYSPYNNACPYCLVCRTCAENEQEVSTCKRTEDRTCMCALGQVCDPASTTVGQQSTTTPTITTSRKITAPATVKFSSTLRPPEDQYSACDKCDTCHNKIIWILVGIVFLMLVVIIAIFVKLKQKCCWNPRVPCEVGNPLETIRILPRNDVDRFIEHLVQLVGPRDLMKIGVQLGFSHDNIETMQSNSRDIEGAYRSMFTVTYNNNPTNFDQTLIEVFRKCQRVDLAEMIEKLHNETDNAEPEEE
ncbi:uncharacterized protein [Antedon mediterranea]|uniref:uncharacterized protein n=1 Tax=Antedon mediterranea TaxID=105859 RepID=UPI003AF9B3DE